MSDQTTTPSALDRLTERVQAQERQIAMLTNMLTAARPTSRRWAGRSGRLGFSSVIALILALLLGTVALAAIPGAGGVITGCYTKMNGALRVIDTAAGQTCTNKELQLTWSQTGPQGATGATGATGPAGPQGPAGASYSAGAGLALTGTTLALDTTFTDGRYWRQGGSAFGATGVIGTTDNQAFEVQVNGQRGLRIEPNTFSPNLIGGSSANSADAGVAGATVGGGGYADGPNRVMAILGTVAGGAGNTAAAGSATVSGGQFNTASETFTTVAGGISNTASGTVAVVGGGRINTASSNASVVAGGQFNTASGFSTTVGGGDHNTAGGTTSVVAGGLRNTASGNQATVIGGSDNLAAGDHSVAAGDHATIAAAHSGTFMFADAIGTAFDSAAANEFAARATGGVRFVTGVGANGAPTAGVSVAPGSGSWSSLSDRNAKTSLLAVDSRAVLRQVEALPLSTWRYTTQDGVRHIGPMAQDFHAAFGVGEDDRHISTVDADGVALAAIQGLGAEIHDRDTTIAALQARLDALERRRGAPASSFGLAALLVILATGGVGLALRGRHLRRRSGS
jgi:hypothetical protein